MNAPAVPINDPKAQHPGWSYLLIKSYGVYKQRFWSLLRIALLPYTLAYIASFFFGAAFRQLQRAGIVTFPPSSMSYVALFVLGWIQGALYWAISGFFFAGVASNVLDGSVEPGLGVFDAFRWARARFGAVLGVALLCWTLFWMGRSLAEIVFLPLTLRLLNHGGTYTNFLYVLVDQLVVLLLAGLVARFGLAIPQLTEEPTVSVRRALRFSVGETENWEPFFMLFLVKSAILMNGVSWLARLALMWFWRNARLSSSAFPWSTKAAYVAIIAALAAPLFIAFSLLYQEALRPHEQSLTAMPAPIE